jgi:predicted enzyme related to lactoylglutathione lyase
MLQGLRTVIFKVTDLAKAKDWYARVFGITPYFDQPYYVGYNVGGYELGLDPDTQSQSPGRGGSTAYWGVKDLKATFDKLASNNVRVVMPLRDVGEGILVGTIEDPFGNHIGLIENPHFALPGGSKSGAKKRVKKAAKKR